MDAERVGTDAVLDALADPGRRALLDALRDGDGASVGELGTALPHLGRHAVLKHVRVLESAGLVVTRKIGRERRCYLNAVPIVELAQRWIDDFGARASAGLLDLRAELETDHDR